jgi:hypothetical protein
MKRDASLLVVLVLGSLVLAVHKQRPPGRPLSRRIRDKGTGGAPAIGRQAAALAG